MSMSHLIKTLPELRQVTTGNFVVGITALSYVVITTSGLIYLFPREPKELDEQFIQNLFGLFNDQTFAELNEVEVSGLKVFKEEDWEAFVTFEVGFTPVLVVPEADIASIVASKTIEATLH